VPAGTEQGNGPIDATLPGIGALGGGDGACAIPLAKRVVSNITLFGSAAIASHAFRLPE
jgi:hypothetical protein